MQVNFKLRDWLFARQRYWGEPFPIVYPEGSEVRSAGSGGGRQSAAGQVRACAACRGMRDVAQRQAAVQTC